MDHKEATKLMENVDFQKAFDRSSLFMERAVALNEKSDIFRIIYEDDQRGEERDEEEELLQLRNEYKYENSQGRSSMWVAWCKHV